MDAAELEKYEYQLSQIKLALAKDPTNTEYLNLKDELSSLIDLTKEFLASSAPANTSSATASTSKSGNSKSSTSGAQASPRPATSSSKPPSHAATPPPIQHSLKSGDECQARYSGDGKFYPAKITSVGGADENRVYNVIFHGYDSTEIVGYSDVKPLTDNKKRQLELSAEDLEKERKRKKNEKKADTKQAKTLEQGLKQKSWQSFAKKSAKKGVVIPGMSGGSMFRSPDDLNPNAKVGVVGSGKGMKPSAERKRTTFTEGGADL